MAEEERNRGQNIGCQEFNANLAAYLEGENIHAVRVHAEQCLSCGPLLADLEEMRSIARDLPLESPSPRVWSNIRATLDQEGYFHKQESLWKRWIAAASFMAGAAPIAALALALVLAIMVVYKGNFRKSRSPIPSPAPVTATVVPAGMSDVQNNLIHTVRAMEENYRAREGLMDPSAKQVYQAGLASLDGSIRECLDSLQKQPQNVLVREYLMQAYAQKAEVLASALEYSGR